MITDDLKLAMAKDITAAYARNEKADLSSEKITDLLKASYHAIDELTQEAKDKTKKVGLG